MEILVARQPVFDRRELLYGYDLVLRRPGVAGAPGEPLPEQLVADTFLGIGIDQVAAGHRAFVTVDRDMLLSGAARLLPPDRVVLQLSGRLHDDSQLIQACDQMVWAGYRFSLSSDRPEELPEEFLRLAEIVKIDVSLTDRQLLVDLSAWLKGFHVRMLASNVSHRVERDLCTNLGFELFEGYKFAEPETLMRRDLPIEHMVTFRLLKLVRDSRATDQEIEEMLRRDVALSYKLLRMVNSASMGGRDIWSIGHALRLLGREQIARWLGLLLVTDSGKDGVRAELTHLTLVRARMCELLADVTGVPRARGSLFLVGMLSLLDRLLETPMGVLADSMELASDVRGALLRREDFFGAVLALVEAYERGAWEDVDALAASLGVGTVQLAPTYLEALAWANAQRASQSSKPGDVRAVR
ncbi:MAG TPA: HDOD domain-containing protein [Gemmatimonadaceae bacterium]|jgi:EAL and modified HD-GYP domain-containing signal transduction protein